jgi:DNA-binding transcriptional LysR family regulator
MTDLNELQIFVQVAKTQSFTTAAERLEIPKSSVSWTIRKLEGRLGLRLIERTTRRVALTEEGQIYFDRCERVLEDAEQAEIEIGALQAKPRGTLRVGTPGIFARYILGPALGEFLAAYPEVRVHLQSLDAISRERPLDVVVRPGPLEDSGYLMKPLLKIRIALYASPSYLKSRSIPDSPAALREHSCIITNCAGFADGNDAAIWRLRRGAEVKEVGVESRVSVPDPAISQQLALTGVGVALLSQSAVRHDVELGRLMRLLPDWEPEPVELHALYASRLSTSPKVRAFVQFLKGRFTGKSYHDLARIYSDAVAAPSQSPAVIVDRAS